MKFFLLTVLSVMASTYNGLAIEDNSGPVYIVKDLEISDEVAVKLCKKLKRQESLDAITNNVFNTSYLWVQVRHQVPGKPNGIVLDAPLLPAGCLKWKLRRCSGEKWPLMRPCTFWDPIRKNTKYCRSTHTKTYKYVFGRPPGAVPGNCMCDFPCEEKYDPYQVCRTELNNVPTRSEPQKPVEVGHHQAVQLCRSVTTSKAMGERMGVLLNWLPIRIQNAMFPDPNDDNRGCPYTWVYTPCENGTTAEVGCGEWEKIDENTPCESVVLGQPDPFPELKTDSPCLRNEFPFPPCPDIERIGKSNTVIPPGALDGGCLCRYPCLPFFDPINQCYSANGQPMEGKNNNHILSAKNYEFSNEKGIIRCKLWEEEIKCGVIPPYSSRPTPILPESTPQERRNMRARRIRKK